MKNSGKQNPKFETQDAKRETRDTEHVTPNRLGYKMPAEWEKHDGTWLSWPKDPESFPADYLGKVEQIYIKMIEELQKGETVNLLVNDNKTEEKVRSMVNNSKNLKFHHITSVDVWMRDYGPIFVVNKKLKKIAATKWVFNSWGEKYYELKYDNTAGMEAARSTGYDVFETGIILEGGSIDSNGAGTCITTEQCLLNKNRNPNLTKKEIETYLESYLGFTNFIWLTDGIEGDLRISNRKEFLANAISDSDEQWSTVFHSISS